MKRSITLGIIGWFIATLGSIKATAQDTPAAPPPPPPPPAVNQKESQEIIIRKKGDKDTKLTLEIADGKVTINGKPLAEFNEDGVTINNRKMIVRDGDKITMNFDGKMMELDSKLADLDRNMKNFDFKFDGNDLAWGGDTKEYTYLGVSTTKTDDGAKVTAVTKDSPAEKAGLQKDDIIYKIDDSKIDGTSSLSDVVRSKKDGEKVKVYYLRDGKKKDVKAVLSTTKSVVTRSFTYTGPDGVKSLTIPRTPRTPGTPRVYGNGNFNDDFNDVQLFTRRQKLGLKIQDTEESTGVKVLDVEAASAAAVAGLMKDDVITEIGGVKVTNTDEAREQLQENKDKSTYAVKAKRNGSEMNFTIKIPKNLKTANL